MRVALFLASTQLPKLFGLHGAHGDFWRNICATSSPISTRPIAPLARDRACRTHQYFILGKIFLKHRPVALFVVLGGIVASVLLDLGARGSTFWEECLKACQRYGICPTCPGPT